MNKFSRNDASRRGGTKKKKKEAIYDLHFDLIIIINITWEKHLGGINNSSVAINVNTESPLRNADRRTIIVDKCVRATPHSLRQPMHASIYYSELNSPNTKLVPVYDTPRDRPDDSRMTALDARGVKSSRFVLCFLCPIFMRFFLFHSITFQNERKKNKNKKNHSPLFSVCKKSFSVHLFNKI